MSDNMEFKVDYMIAVHRAPDYFPEEQEFTVIQGCIDKQYVYSGWEDKRKLQEAILDDVKKEFIDKVEKEHGGYL